MGELILAHLQLPYFFELDEDLKKPPMNDKSTHKPNACQNVISKLSKNNSATQLMITIPSQAKTQNKILQILIPMLKLHLKMYTFDLFPFSFTIIIIPFIC